jgi:2-keto-4-pentenoate hydratase
MRRLVLPALAFALLASPVSAACPGESEIAALASSYFSLEPAALPPADLTFADGMCGQAKLNRHLQRFLGPQVGYKAGLTNPAVQQRFNHAAPVRGTLYQGMMLKEGAILPAKFGSRPMFEADLVAVVKDAGLARARSPEEAIRHIASIRPFIELPDLVVQDPGKLNGAGIALINVGARYGVLGTPVAVQPSKAWVEGLKSMTVRLVDQSGAELDSAKGEVILGHPLMAAIWIAQDLEKGGMKIKKGDLLSLGSFSKLLPPKAGQSVTVRYEGLPVPLQASVSFR